VVRAAALLSLFALLVALTACPVADVVSWGSGHHGSSEPGHHDRESAPSGQNDDDVDSCCASFLSLMPDAGAFEADGGLVNEGEPVAFVAGLVERSCFESDALGRLSWNRGPPFCAPVQQTFIPCGLRAPPAVPSA